MTRSGTRLTSDSASAASGGTPKIAHSTIKPPSWAPTAAYVLGCLVGVVALFTVISAGHSGSALVWKDLGNFVSSK